MKAYNPFTRTLQVRASQPRRPQPTDLLTVAERHWWASFEQCRAFKNQTGAWPFTTDPALGTFMGANISRWREKPESYSQEQHLALRHAEFPREGEGLRGPRPSRTRLGGLLHRVRQALATGTPLANADLNQLRQSYNNGQLSEKTYQELRAAGVDVSLRAR